MGDTADVRLLRKSPDGFQRQGGGGIGIELHTYRCRWKIILCIKTARFHWGSVVMGFGQDGPALRNPGPTRHSPENCTISVRRELRFGPGKERLINVVAGNGSAGGIATRRGSDMLAQDRKRGIERKEGQELKQTG